MLTAGEFVNLRNSWNASSLRPFASKNCGDSTRPHGNQDKSSNIQLVGIPTAEATFQFEYGSMTPKTRPPNGHPKG